MISFKLPPRGKKFLAEIAEVTGVSRDRIALDAGLERLEDWEDAKIAEQRDDDGVYVSMEEIATKYRWLS